MILNTIFILIVSGIIGFVSSDDNPVNSELPQELYDLQLADLHIRDPFVFVDEESGSYYLHVNDYEHNVNNKIRVYKSKNLRNWKDMGYSFVPDNNFWGTKDFWAPDLYKYKGKYYLFVTFSSDNHKRGTSILVADTPQGPFEPLINNAVTPKDWMCLDGALYIDKEDKPWIIYCHEWVQVKDGEVIAQRLSDDLTQTVGDPYKLFSATEAPWVGTISSASLGVTEGYITDAPFIHEMDNGELIMLWSSRANNGKYAIGLARSENGSLLGPWTQNPEPLNDDDGGHAMLFKDFTGNLKISYHTPNSKTEHAVFRKVLINNGSLVISDY